MPEYEKLTGSSGRYAWKVSYDGVWDIIWPGPFYVNGGFQVLKVHVLLQLQVLKVHEASKFMLFWKLLWSAIESRSGLWHRWVARSAPTPSPTLPCLWQLAGLKSSLTFGNLEKKHPSDFLSICLKWNKLHFGKTEILKNWSQESYEIKQKYITWPFFTFKKIQMG